jgi:tryptophanyl-tRNA synthetase
MPLRARCVPLKRSVNLRHQGRCFASKAEVTIGEDASKEAAATPARNAPIPVKSKPSKKNRIVFSGIQPTGVPHLGNYLGALRQWKKFADDAPKQKGKQRLPINYFSVVDLHALTAPMVAAERLELQKQSYAALLAMGVVNNQSTAVFFQSEVCREQGALGIR